MKNYPSLKELALLLLIAFLAILVHGYHPGVEDAEIYLPGVKKALDPSLYPQNAAFFASHAHLTLFPNLIAISVRISHLPLDWAMFLWHWFSIFLLLLACWYMGQIVWRGHSCPCSSGQERSPEIATWGGVALVASLLTIPVAGTALYIMDEYVTTRSLSTPAVLFIVMNAAQRKWARALLWTIFTALVHPLMVVFGISFAVIFWWMGRQGSSRPRDAAVAAALLFPFGLFPRVTESYREVLNSRPYFFLLQWRWYEWLGIFAPLALLWWFRSLAARQELILLQRMCAALVVYALLFFAAALVITIPPAFANLAELQPMRYLHLLYMLLFVFAGGFLARFGLRDHVWRWVALFVPLCAGMCFAQRQMFPATPHLEWPGAAPHNPWAKAFVWISQRTPKNAYFALDPNYMALPGEDQHGFRALAERSRMADKVKDSGAVTMFPALAETWSKQVHELEAWKNFQASDFRRLQSDFGVDWVVLQQPGVTGLNCPFRNHAVVVCRIE